MKKVIEELEAKSSKIVEGMPLILIQLKDNLLHQDQSCLSRRQNLKQHSIIGARDLDTYLGKMQDDTELCEMLRGHWFHDFLKPKTKAAKLAN